MTLKYICHASRGFRPSFTLITPDLYSQKYAQNEIEAFHTELLALKS